MSVSVVGKMKEDLGIRSNFVGKSNLVVRVGLLDEMIFELK
jgi:hypothetical protein